jgi:hypothetical protein
MTRVIVSCMYSLPLLGATALVLFGGRALLHAARACLGKDTHTRPGAVRHSLQILRDWPAGAGPRARWRGSMPVTCSRCLVQDGYREFPEETEVL